MQTDGSQTITISGSQSIKGAYFKDFTTCAITMSSCKSLSLLNSHIVNIRANSAVGGIYVSSTSANGQLNMRRTCFFGLTSKGYGNALRFNAPATATISFDANTVTGCYDASGFPCSRTICLIGGKHLIDRLNSSKNKIENDDSPGLRLENSCPDPSVGKYATLTDLTAKLNAHGIGPEPAGASEMIVEFCVFVRTQSQWVIGGIQTTTVRDCCFRSNTGTLRGITNLIRCNFDSGAKYAAANVEAITISGPTPEPMAHLSTDKCEAELGINVYTRLLIKSLTLGIGDFFYALFFFTNSPI